MCAIRRYGIPTSLITGLWELTSVTIGSGSRIDGGDLKAVSAKQLTLGWLMTPPQVQPRSKEPHTVPEAPAGLLL